MATTKTYAVGNGGKVRRLDDHIGPWIDVSVGNGKTNLQDVVTDPSNPDKVFVVGTVTTGTLVSGLGYSINAGLSWVIPGGNWNTGPATIFYEVWAVDSLVIWAVGEFGTVIKSIDGGLNFNITGAIDPDPQRYTTAIHALDDQVAVVAGGPSIAPSATIALAWKTIDGGATWFPLNGGTTLLNTNGASTTVGAPEAIWISGDQKNVIVSTEYTQNVSLDFGNTFVDNLAETPRSGRHMTWYPSHASIPTHFRHVGGPVIHVNESVNTGASWTTTRASEGIIINGAHFYSVNNGYYCVGATTFVSTDGGASGVTSDPAASTGTSSLNAVWTTLTPIIYSLTDCEGAQATIYSTSSLLQPVIGSIINIDAVGIDPTTCWTIGVLTRPLTVTLTFITSVLNSFDDCAECILPPPDSICWDLVSCNGDCDDILGVTGTDFTPYTGGLVTVNNDTSCVYEPHLLRQAYFPCLRTSVLSNPAGAFQLGADDKVLEITSFIYNGVQYITGVTPTYALNPSNYIVAECVGLTCTTVPSNTTENCIENVPVFFNLVVSNLGLSDRLQGFCNDPNNCFVQDPIGDPGTPLETFRIQYRDGDTFSITFNVTDAAPSSGLFEVSAGNLTQSTDLLTATVLETCNSVTFCDPTGATTVSEVSAWLFPCPTPIPEIELGEACEIKPKIGEPGFSTKHCDPRKVVAIKTKYADSVFALFKRMRYGIETCCEYDLDEIDVKNSLLDLGNKFDPDLCVSGQPVPFGCCPRPCNTIATILIPQALACPAPDSTVALLAIIPANQACPPPEASSAALSIV